MRLNKSWFATVPWKANKKSSVDCYRTWPLQRSFRNGCKPTVDYEDTYILKTKEICGIPCEPVHKDRTRSGAGLQKIGFICFQFFLERGIETMSSILIQ